MVKDGVYIVEIVDGEATVWEVKDPIHSEEDRLETKEELFSEDEEWHCQG